MNEKKLNKKQAKQVRQGKLKEEELEREKLEQRKLEVGKIGIGSFVIGWLSFVPIIGVFFSLIAIMLGLASEKEGAKKLTVLGLIGFLYSLIIYAVVIYLEVQKQGS